MPLATARGASTDDPPCCTPVDASDELIVCVTCLIPQPRSSYYTQPNRDGRPFKWCKKCHVARNKLNHARRAQRRVATLPKEKPCATCERTFPIAAFKGRDSRATGVRVFRDCPKCRSTKGIQQAKTAKPQRTQAHGPLDYAEQVLNAPTFDAAVMLSKAMADQAQVLYFTEFTRLTAAEQAHVARESQRIVLEEPKRYL